LKGIEISIALLGSHREMGRLLQMLNPTVPRPAIAENCFEG